jgi:hypothetical protein
MINKIFRILAIVTLLALAFGVTFQTVAATGGGEPPLTVIVKKTAETIWQRVWNWKIEKSADQSSLTLAVGQQYTVNYMVTVDANKTDSGFMVSGEISFKNDTGGPITVTSITDTVSDGIVLPVVCPDFSLPKTYQNGYASAPCTYSGWLPNGLDRVNTATVTLEDGRSFTGTANVVFSDTPQTETDKCINVSDSLYGSLGTVCAGDAPKTFTYSMTVGPYEACGNYQVKNIATFTTNDTKTTGSDDWTVDVKVPCAGGCSLTPGYWKTHSEFGPAPYDDTWAQLPNGASTPFFSSGKSFYEALWTSPRGNAYWILAHAYIAAQLNFLNGADPSAAQAAFNSATALFNTFTPAQIGALKGSSTLRQQFIALAGILDNYNNGLTGPGHCSE